ncbi:MAG: protein kinase [Acidobacteriota bacterium]
MIGTSLGHYEILEPLGAGGMGEVYLGEDTRLGRKVAIKVLPAEFAADPERLARFEQEARAAAALNHPHIAVVHDIGFEPAKDRSADEGAAATGIHYMVQEYLEGQSLRERLDKGELRLEKALDLAIEVGEALIAAHKAGIVDRDLKPDNIFVTEEGHAKVLDFGLAKLTEVAAPAGSSASRSPTMLATVAGQVMGTAGYMAPEQVQGDVDVDQRADHFAFGCLLYEMIGGKRAFGGETVVDTLHAIARTEPQPLGELKPGLPAELQRIVRKCLAKEAARRYQTSDDIVVDLRQLEDDIAAGVAPSAASRVQEATGPVASGWSTAVLVAATVVIGLLVGSLTWLATRPGVTAPPALADFEIPLPEGLEFTAPTLRLVAFSPDGSQIVMAANKQLWRRAIGETEMTPVRGTEAELFTASPFFSPDGQEIGFLADFELKRVAATGGAPQVLLSDERSLLHGGSWADDGNIYFGRGTGGIWRVAANGGEPEKIVPLESGSARAPQLLPGGQWVLFTLREGPDAEWDEASVVVHSLVTGERRELFRGGTDARYLSSGHIVYAHGSTLLARAFDVDRLAVEEVAVPVREGVGESLGGAFGAAHWDASDNGGLVYVPGTLAGAGTGLTWYSADGKVEPLPLPPTEATLRSPRLSPSGDRIAVELFDEDGSRLVTYAIEQANFQPFAAPGRFPAWAPDGEWLYFSSDSGGDFDIYRGQVASTVVPVPVLRRDGAQMVTDVAEDRLLFDERKETGERDIWTLALAEGAEPELVVGGPEDASGAVFFPDGKWIAYRSGGMEGVAGEIWAQEFPGPGAKHKVSAGVVASNPVWVEPGLFYDAGGRWMFVEDLDPGPGFIPAPARVLLQRVLLPSSSGRNYDVSGNGKRLLTPRIPAASDNSAGPSIRVVLNWFEELKSRVPTERSR